MWCVCVCVRVCEKKREGDEPAAPPYSARSAPSRTNRCPPHSREGGSGRALPIETNVESGKFQSKSGTSVNSSDSGDLQRLLVLREARPLVQRDVRRTLGRVGVEERCQSIQQPRVERLKAEVETLLI